MQQDASEQVVIVYAELLMMSLMPLCASCSCSRFGCATFSRSLTQHSPSRVVSHRCIQLQKIGRTSSYGSVVCLLLTGPCGSTVELQRSVCPAVLWLSTLSPLKPRSCSRNVGSYMLDSRVDPIGFRSSSVSVSGYRTFGLGSRYRV